MTQWESDRLIGIIRRSHQRIGRIRDRLTYDDPLNKQLGEVESELGEAETIARLVRSEIDSDDHLRRRGHET